MLFTSNLKRGVLSTFLVLGLCSFGCNRLEDEIMDDSHGLAAAFGDYHGVLEAVGVESPGFMMELDALGNLIVPVSGADGLVKADAYVLFSNCQPLGKGWSTTEKDLTVTVDIYKTPMEMEVSSLEEGWKFVGYKVVELVTP